MANNWLALSVALIFVWLGMVLAISFLEAPLKFRAPGVTLPIGLGGLWLAFYVRNLSSRPLLPEHDPGFEEALAHGRE